MYLRGERRAGRLALFHANRRSLAIGRTDAKALRGRRSVVGTWCWEHCVGSRTDEVRFPRSTDTSGAGPTLDPWPGGWVEHLAALAERSGRKPADERNDDKRDKVHTAGRGRTRYAHEGNGVRSWEDTWLSHTVR